MEVLMALSAGIALVNVALLIALLTIYARIYKSTRAVFTVGLMFFADANTTQHDCSLCLFFDGAIV